MCWRKIIVFACACGVLMSATDAGPVRRALSDLAARRRSMTDKNFMRFGRSNPSYRQITARPINSDVHREPEVIRSDPDVRFVRSRPDTILRLGRGGSTQVFIPASLQESLQESLHHQEEKHYPDYQELSHNFLEEGLFPEAEKRNSKNIDFLRYGRGNANYLRFGRSAVLDDADQDSTPMDSLSGEDRVENDKVFYDVDFMRYGRSGNSESAMEIDLPANDERKRRHAHA